MDLLCIGPAQLLVESELILYEINISSRKKANHSPTTGDLPTCQVTPDKLSNTLKVTTTKPKIQDSVNVRQCKFNLCRQIFYKLQIVKDLYFYLCKK